MNKLLLLGITGSGKSTISEPIGQALGLKILEVDQEVIRLNNGLWPKDGDTIRKYMLATNDTVLEMDHVLYVTSWLDKENIKRFYNKGFKIIELHADFDELLKRKINRDKPPQDQIDQFKEDSEGYYEVINDPDIQSLITLSLDTTSKPIESVIKSIYSSLEYLAM